MSAADRVLVPPAGLAVVVALACCRLCGEVTLRAWADGTVQRLAEHRCGDAPGGWQTEPDGEGDEP